MENKKLKITFYKSQEEESAAEYCRNGVGEKSGPGEG
jgi:hypothetical protein